jgi:hypothetical protein
MTIDRLWKNFFSLSDDGKRIGANMKTSSADIRAKLIPELRSLDGKRLKLLDQIDALPKPNQTRGEGR